MTGQCQFSQSNRRPGGHGGSSFQTAMTIGAFAALDQLPPDDTSDRPARPRWSERFGLLLDAYQAEQDGQRDAVREILAQAKFELPSNDANVAQAVAATIGRGDDVDGEQFQSLFGWIDTPTARNGSDVDQSKANSQADTDRGADVDSAVGRRLPALQLYIGLSPVYQIIWILKILCCALAWRRNDFGRYFAPNGNPPAEPTLEALSVRMNEGFENPAGDGDVPVGFVFFAQFVDHDLTFDATSRLGNLINPGDIDNLRSPAFDLDNIYADGPEGSPEIYDVGRGFGYLLTAADGRDLARNHLGRAIIGDPRNDENTLVSQFHLHMLHAHNAVLRMIQNTDVDALWGREPLTEPDDEIGEFEFARRMMRWHYQWAAVNDWLPRIVDPTVLTAAHAITGVPQGVTVPALPGGYATAQAIVNSLDLIDCCGHRVCRPLMPVEFSAAAFRFAHSQVRSRYDLNDDRLDVPLFAPSPPALAFFGPVAGVDLVDWERFFELDPTVTPQMARQIDTWMSAQVFQLPFAPDDPNLALRNLVRGAITFALPSGQDVANQLGVPLVLGQPAITKLNEVGMAVGDAPLWFTVLGEAEANAGRLGPVGGLLVAASLFRMLVCDEESYVHHAGWEPVLISSASPPDFTVADLVRIGVNERNDAFPTP